MAAHRELWHKGLQRRALLTRKLGLARPLLEVETEILAIDDVPILDRLPLILIAQDEAGRSLEHALPQLFLVEAGGQEAEIIEILGPGREDLSSDDVKSVNEPHLNLAECTEVDRPRLPPLWQVMALKVGDAQTIAGRKVLEDLTLVTDFHRNLVNDVHILRGPGQEASQDQRCGPAHRDCRGGSNRAAQLSQELTNRDRAQVRHQTFLERGKLDIAMTLRDIRCSRPNGLRDLDGRALEQVIVQHRRFDGLFESLPALLDELEGPPVQVRLDQNGLDGSGESRRVNRRAREQVPESIHGICAADGLIGEG